MGELNMDAVLCFVKGAWASFTTQPLEDQWGDDWNDAPYESNAGLPYDDWKPRNAGDDWEPAWEIITVAFSGPFETPGHYSVEDINHRAAPWLRESWWSAGNAPRVKIDAGTTLRDFIKAVESVDGTVYVPLEGCRKLRSPGDRRTIPGVLK